MKLSIKLFLPIIIVIHIAAWYLAYYYLSVGDTYSIYNGFLNFLIDKQGEFYSTLLMSLLSINILLASRLSILDKIFSGLDKVYLTHKYSGYLIFLLIILHSSFIGESRIKYQGFYFLSKEIAGPMMFAFLALIIISVLPHIPYVKKIFNIPYHIWKYTHYLMGLLFLVGIYHSVGVNSLTFSNGILSTYMYIMYIVGIFFLFYKTLIYKFIIKKYKYVLTDIKRFDSQNIIELKLKPKILKIF